MLNPLGSGELIGGISILSPDCAETNLVDLEHASLRALMLGEERDGKRRINPVHAWWNTRVALSGEMQRKQPFRYDPMGRKRYGLLPDEDGEIEFRRFLEDGETQSVGNLKHDIDPKRGPRIGFWDEPDYETALEALAESLGMETLHCAKRFGVLDLPAKGADNGWSYHPALGFSRKK